MKTLGQVLATSLESYGIDIVFGIPGVHTIELYRGLGDTHIRHITPRHEQGGGFMADGYARVTGRPAACYIITGPGMTNIMTAMAQANADSVPMLVISAVNRTYDLAHGDGHLHELPDQSQTISGVCRFSHRLARPEDLPKVLARAFTVFRGGRPGPVHIEIPINVISQCADHVESCAVQQIFRPAPDPRGIAAAAAMISQARNPMIVLGGGAQDYPFEAKRLVDRIGARTILTVNGKGLLPPDHPLSLGARLPQSPVREALEAADVVLAIGTEIAETDTLLFDGSLKIDGKVIRIDIDINQLVKNAIPTIGICADAGLGMFALYNALADLKSFDAEDDVRKLRNLGDASMPLAYSDHGMILQKFADKFPNLIIVGDSTQPIYGGNMFYEPAQTRSYFNSTTGYGTLGYALPAAIGAKLAAGNKPVLSVIGDGGLQFSIGELAVLTEADTPIIILVWNNYGYREIKDFMVRADLPTIGVDVSGPKLDMIAKAYECDYSLIRTRKDLDHTIEGLSNLRRSLILEIVEDNIHATS